MKRLGPTLFLILILCVAVSCGPDSQETRAPSSVDSSDPAGAARNETPGSVEGFERASRSVDESTAASVCEKIPLEPIELPDVSSPPTEVHMDADGFFVVNGTKFFPYGFYNYPSDPAALQEFVDAGFNFTVFYGGCCQGGTLQAQIAKLELLHSYGILAAPHGFAPVDQIYSQPFATLRDWLDQRADAGALLFWYTIDEPAIWSWDPEVVEDLNNMLHTLDPDHPNGLVMAGAEDYTEYIDYTDFLMIDPYPAPLFPMNNVKYCYLEAEAACTGNQRVFGVPQAFDWYLMYGSPPPNHEWRPYVWEMRNNTYQYLTFGANGLSYFAYNYVYSQPDRWEGLKEIAAEVKELMPVILEPIEAIELAEEPDLPHVDYSVREHDGIYYLMVISTWTHDLTVSYDLSPLGTELCVIDYFDDAEVEVSADNKITLDLARGEEAVLQIIP
jgi:hypothetical protein